MYDDWVVLSAPAGSVVGLAGLVGSLAAIGGGGASWDTGSVANAVEALAASDRSMLVAVARRWPPPAAGNQVVDRAWAAALRHLGAAGRPPPLEGAGPAVDAEAVRLAAERRGVDASAEPVDPIDLADPRSAGLRPITRAAARTLRGGALRALRLRPELAEPVAIEEAARSCGVPAALALELGAATGLDVTEQAAASASAAMDAGAFPQDVAPTVWAVLAGWRLP